MTYLKSIKNEIEIKELTGNNMIDSILTIKKYNNCLDVISIIQII